MIEEREENTPEREAIPLKPQSQMSEPGADQEGGAFFSAARMLQLEADLEGMCARLKASSEERDAAKEELRAANEDLQSLNERYLSAAEELETNKKELQTINEELQRVNAGLKIEIDSISRANNDLKNLMGATEMGALFLDRRLRIERFTPKIAELFDIRAASEGAAVFDLIGGLDASGFARDAEAILKGESLIEREMAVGGRWFLARLRPYQTVDGRVEGVVCTFVEITGQVQTAQALKSNEEHLRLLTSELSHRVKNTLAVVQAMARLSFRLDEQRDEALEAFTNRLSALSAAHDVLVKSDWRGARLKDLAEKQLALLPLESGRVEIDGPAIFLRPDLASPVGLVIHELATNAVKYGAFSTKEGTLKVFWNFTGGGAAQQFQLRWEESGGPAVEPPDKQGFGSYLIQNGVPDATVELDFNPGGLLYVVTFPADSVQRE